MQDNDVLEEQIEGLYAELQTTGINYSDWEENFIEDMKRKLDAGTSFSPSQVKQIERLYSKYISGDEDGRDPEDTFERFNRR